MDESCLSGKACNLPIFDQLSDSSVKGFIHCTSGTARLLNPSEEVYHQRRSVYTRYVGCPDIDL